MTLPQELQQFVAGAIASGKYASPDEVVTTALRLLQDHERKLSALRSDLRVGIEELERGEGIAIDGQDGHNAFFDDIERRGRERLAEKDETS